MPRKSFLETYYAQARRNMGDAQVSKRVTNEDLLNDLETADQMFFEELLPSTLQESTFGYATADIEIVAGQEFYRLPFGFRQFLHMYKLDTDGGILGSIHTQNHYGLDGSIEILDGNSGFRIPSIPTSEDAGTWTLGFIRGPGKLHYAKATRIGSKSIVSGDPPTDGGEVILVPDYYNGQQIWIYAALSGAPQFNQVTKSTVDGNRVIYHLRHALFPTSGEVWYEIRPTLPPPQDAIYAVEAAIVNLDRRKQPEAVTLLEKQRKRLLSMARKYVASNTADRPMSMVRPVRAKNTVGISQSGVYS